MVLSSYMYIHIGIAVFVREMPVKGTWICRSSQCLVSLGVGLDTEDIWALIGLFDLGFPFFVVDRITIADAPRADDVVVPCSGADVGLRLGHEDDCAPQESEECKVSFHEFERCAS